jgi:hypothetical protein
MAIKSAAGSAGSTTASTTVVALRTMEESTSTAFLELESWLLLGLTSTLPGTRNLIAVAVWRCAPSNNIIAKIIKQIVPIIWMLSVLMGAMITGAAIMRVPVFRL